MNPAQLENLRRLEAVAREAIRAAERARVLVFVVKDGRKWVILRRRYGADPTEQQYVTHCRNAALANEEADRFAAAQGFTRVEAP